MEAPTALDVILSARDARSAKTNLNVCTVLYPQCSTANIYRSLHSSCSPTMHKVTYPTVLYLHPTLYGGEEQQQQQQQQEEDDEEEDYVLPAFSAFSAFSA